MAVVVQYIVVRDGDEKMTFATKKEADAYDKMLDIADNLFDFLGASDIRLDETRKEELSLLFAQKRDEVMPILRGVSPVAKTSQKKSAKPKGKAAAKQAAPKKADTSKPSETAEATPVPKSAANAASHPTAASLKKSAQAG